MLLKKYEIHTRNKWYSHVPNVVTETDDGKVTIYWDKPIKTDRKVKYNRPDVVVIDREGNMWYIVILRSHVKEKEEEKIDKYLDLATEVPAKLSESLEKLEREDVIQSLQTPVLTSKVRVRT